MMLSKGCLTLQQCRANLLHKPVTISNSVNTRLFSDNINNSEDAKVSLNQQSSAGVAKPDHCSRSLQYSNYS